MHKQIAIQAAHRPKAKGLRRLPAMDLPFLLLVLALVGAGLVMLGSASSAVALYRRGDPYAYLRPQLLYAALGIAAMWVASRVDYHIYHRLAWGLLAVSLVLLTAVLFMPEYNGCRRWLVLPGLGTLQPSEIAKFAVVLVFAHIISLNHSRMGSFGVGVLPFVLVLGVVAALMLLEPHLSGTVLILCTGAVLMIVGGIQAWLVAAGVGGVGAVGFLFVKLAEKGIIKYGSARIAMWHDPWLDYSGDGYQLAQSLITIGSGGLLGVGLGRSRQKFLYLPEQYNDFIFSVVCEELGLIGACVIMLIFALLILRGFWIALHARDRFGALLVVGIMTHLALQTFLNIAVVSGFVPTTGISLPFFSYGGTALCLQLVEMGIVLSVSRQIPAPKAG